MRFSTYLRPYRTKVVLRVVPKDHPQLSAEGADALTLCYAEDNKVELLLTKEASAGIIAHECFHAVKFALETARIRLQGASEEAYAYSLGDLVDWVSVKLIQKQPQGKT